jgi:hypothetical protein
MKGKTTMRQPNTLTIALEPSVPGNFTVAHGQTSTPALVLIQMTSGGLIWFQTPTHDETNIYLVAADGCTGNAIVFLETE